MQYLKPLSAAIIFCFVMGVTNQIHAQTKVLKHISAPDEYDRIDYPTVVDSVMFFTADNGDDEGELYVTDGTPEGTKVLTDLAPPNYEPDIYELTPFNGKLLFQAYTEELGMELYISDGTKAGTNLVKDINDGDEWGEPEFFGVLDNRAFFQADLGGFPKSKIGAELWVTDGTTAGTKLLKDLAPGYSYSSTFLDTITHDSRPWDFRAIGDKLYFSAQTPNEGREPWVSDGTPEGTYLIKDMNPGKSEFDNPFPSDPAFYEINGKAIFVAATDEEENRKLFVTDGTAEGTELLLEFDNKASGGSGYGLHGEPVELNGSWYFLHNAKLWKSDATAAGTEMIIDMTEEYIIDDHRDLDNKLIPYKGELYFFGEYHLWKTDGTASGTVKAVESKFKRIVDYENHEVIQLNNRLYFVASDDAYGLAEEVGQEMWMSDGTPEGTTWVTDLRTGTERGGPAGSDPHRLRLLNNHILFIADGDEYWDKLWITTGFPERNAIVEDTARTVNFADLGLTLDFPEINLDTTFMVEAIHNLNTTFEGDSLADSLEVITEQSWTILADTAAAFNAEACFDLGKFKNNYTEDDELRVIKRDSAGSKWDLITTEIRTGDDAICAVNVSSFSDFTVAKIVEVDNNDDDATDVSNEELNQPNIFALNPAYPNPFNPNTTISYSVPAATNVQLTVFNITGQKVATLVNERQNAGAHQVKFNAERLSSGVYFYRLQAAGKTQVQKMTLLK